MFYLHIRHMESKQHPAVRFQSLPSSQTALASLRSDKLVTFTGIRNEGQQYPQGR